MEPRAKGGMAVKSHVLSLAQRSKDHEPGYQPASDKIYWHRFAEVYYDVFSSLGEVKEVLQFGASEGNAVQWLSKQFPQARIVGADTVSQLPVSPNSDRIEYLQVDAGDRVSIRDLFASLDRQFDLLIDDGSHLPEHQMICLTEGFCHVRAGKLYIVEDIHTSHLLNSHFKHMTPIDHANSLSLLLAFEHLKATGKDFDEIVAEQLASTWLTAKGVHDLYNEIESVTFHARSTLPLQCFRCGGSTFDYVRMRCSCGTDLYAPADSMVCFVKKRAARAVSRSAISQE